MILEEDTVSKTYSVVIEIDPVPKARARITANGRYTPKSTVAFENTVAWRFVERCGKPRLKGPVSITVDFHLRSIQPEQAGRLHTGLPHATRPDGDNLFKAVADSLRAIAWIDDSQIADLTVRKFWSTRGKIDITISEIE